MPRRRTPPPTRVVFYHRIGPIAGDPAEAAGDGGAMITPPEHLAAHVEALRELGYTFATAGELADHWKQDGKPPPGIAVLTFDDGWRDACTWAAPLLRSLGVRATFFVCPGTFGKRFPGHGEDAALMTEQQARELSRSGMELASHTMTHPDLRESGPRSLWNELVASRRAVEDLTGERCVTLAYPSGLYNRRVMWAAGRAGYRLAFAARRGPWLKLAVPRFHPPTRESPDDLIWRLCLPADYYSSARYAGSQVAGAGGVSR